MAKKGRKTVRASEERLLKELFQGQRDGRDPVVADDLRQKSPLRIVESVTTYSVSEKPKVK